MSNQMNTEQMNLFETSTDPKEANMPENQSNMVNLLEVAVSESAKSLLEVVRLGNDETVIIAFTADSEAVDIHYCSETEIKGYVICNGSGCVLCRIGRKKDQRYLLPVYSAATGCVGVLPVSPSLRPFALLPQISNVLKANKPMVMFITRDGGKYIVSTAELQNDVDGGEAEIKRFQNKYEAGLHDLTSVFPRIDNEQLAEVEEISRILKLKGVRWDAGDKRS